MKKVLCIFFAIVMITELSACGKKQEGTGTVTPSVSYASAQEVTESQIIASVSSVGSPKYAMSPEDSQYIRTLLSREMHETVFSGSADYEITVSGSTFYYNSETGDFGNSAVITLNGEEKETFEKTVAKYFAGGTTEKEYENSTRETAAQADNTTAQTPGTTVVCTGQKEPEKRVNPENPPVRYIRANESDYNDGAVYPKVVFIKSVSELNAYKSRNASKYYFDSGFGSSESFNDATLKYDDGFFKDKALVMVVTRESSGSVYYEGVSVNGSEGTIAVNRYFPEVFTCDMASWHIIIELDRNDPVFGYSPSQIQVLMSE
ncbi:MAG: hypothetical protein IK085_09760 [Clostridia bacterium]|nr:hypothetical protein [Clostridia bacterium]